MPRATRTAEAIVRLRPRLKSAAVFLFGLLAGVTSSALGDPGVASPARAVAVVFDVRERPIALLNWTILLAVAVVTAGPAIAEAMVRRTAGDTALARLLSDSRLAGLESRAVISIDGATTLARSPNIHEGWRLDEKQIDFRHEDKNWRWPGVSEQDLTHFAETHEQSTSAGNGTLLMLVKGPVAMTDVPVLHLQTRSVRFFDILFYREKLFDPAHLPELVNGVISSGTIEFPHPFTVQAVVVTSDRKVLLTQRSAHVHWYPERWSCSLEEGMNLDDVRTGRNTCASIQALITRALREELGLADLIDFHGGDARILSVFIEASPAIVGVELCAVVRLMIDSRALDQRLREATSRDDDEFRDWRLAQGSDLLAYLGGGATDAFHPTSRYRMLMYLLHERGHSRVARDLEADLRRSQRDPLGLFT